MPPDDTQEYVVSLTCPHCGQKFDKKVDVDLYYKTQIDVVPQDN